MCIIRLIFLYTLLMHISVYAQEHRPQKDAALWFNVYLEKKIYKKYYIHLNQQNRIVNNMSDFGLWYADIGITYKINKSFKILGDYVFAQKRKQDRWSDRHQLYMALYSKKKYARWSLTHRGMIQNGYTDVLSSEMGKIPKLYFRNKFTIKHELNKYISYYVAQEFYLPLNDYRQRNFDRSRSFAGMFYALSAWDELESYLLFQNELNPLKRRSQDYVVGLGYSKSF